MNWNPLPQAGVEIHPAMPKAMRERPDVSEWRNLVEPGSESHALDPDEPYTCWCGETGTYAQLCDQSAIHSGCDGFGVINCLCGGDQCVCHHHGEIECLGCPECEEPDDEQETEP